MGNPHDPEAPAHNNMHIFTSTPRYVGDPIAGVIAENELSAQRALDLIEVNYQQHTPVFTPKEAKGHPPLHECAPNNVVGDWGDYCDGEPKQTLETASTVIERTFHTSPLKHCHIETCSSYAYSTGNGRVTVVTTTQSPFAMRKRIADATQGHDVASTAAVAPRYLYDFDSADVSVTTMYTNLPTGGAMRAYGTPQAFFRCRIFDG